MTVSIIPTNTPTVTPAAIADRLLFTIGDEKQEILFQHAFIERSNVLRLHTFLS